MHTKLYFNVLIETKVTNVGKYILIFFLVTKFQSIYLFTEKNCNQSCIGYHMRDRVQIRKDVFTRWSKQKQGKSGSRTVPLTESNKRIIERMSFLDGKVGSREKSHCTSDVSFI